MPRPNFRSWPCCSFCDGDTKDVEFLFVANEGTSKPLCICSDCIDQCTELVAEKRAEKAAEKAKEEKGT